MFHKQIHTISSEKGGRNLGYSVPRSPLAKKLRQWCLVLSPIRTRDQLLLSFQAHTLHTLKTLCYNNRKWSKMAIHLEYLAKFFFSNTLQNTIQKSLILTLPRLPHLLFLLRAERKKWEKREQVSWTIFCHNTILY